MCIPLDVEGEGYEDVANNRSHDTNDRAPPLKLGVAVDRIDDGSES